MPANSHGKKNTIQKESLFCNVQLKYVVNNHKFVLKPLHNEWMHIWWQSAPHKLFSGYKVKF